MPDSPWILPAAGLIIGCLLGGVARWNHFCTLSALERHWYANDSTGLRTWVLAGAIALITTQGLLALDLVSLEGSFYLAPRLNLIGIVVGGVLFGIGMALVGTCGFGALVRLGSGSLRSLIVVIAIGLAALTAQRGIVGRLRVDLLEPLSLQFDNTDTQSIADIASAATGASIGLPVTILYALALLFWVFSAASYRSQGKSVITGTVVGLCVTMGWWVTYYLSTVLYRQVQIESASFVMPPGEVVLGFIAVTGSIPDYGMGLVVGVIIGAALIASLNDDVRWEACDDARELGRHLAGAFLMGTGGVLAGGCTVGQGISALSTMALSAPIALISICIGARIGLRWLIEGTPSLFTNRA